MKKFLLSTLSVLTIANVSFAGNDKGNAGDGLIINNEIVMRDFVKGATLTTIENNAEFLAGIPDLKELIAEIAQANGNVAMNILSDLSAKVFYISQDPLPKNSGREPLLYFFDGAYMLVSPNFFKARNQSLILVTEALRPYVSPRTLYRGSNYERKSAEAENAFAKAVNYITQNRGAYKSKALVDNLEDLIGDSSYNSLTYLIFNTKLSNDVRCAAMGDQHESLIPFLEEYLSLPCDTANKPYGYYQERVLAATIKMPGWKYTATNEQLYDSENYETGWFANYSSEITRGPEWRIRSCKDHVATIKSLPEGLARVQLQLDMLNAVLSLLESKNGNAAEREIIGSYVKRSGKTDGLKEQIGFVLSSKNANLRSNQFIAKELAYCATLGIK